MRYLDNPARALRVLDGLTFGAEEVQSEASTSCEGLAEQIKQAVQELRALAHAYESCMEDPECSVEALQEIVKQYGDQNVEAAKLVQRYALLCGLRGIVTPR